MYSPLPLSSNPYTCISTSLTDIYRLHATTTTTGIDYVSGPAVDVIGP